MTIRPLIVICGTTGVGKSKLAIELALRIAHGIRGWQGARVINADSMQIYNGVDVITNKVPVSERQGIEHLLMGIREPGEQYVVGQWVQDAIKLIEETHLRSQIPIVVGGTSYWIQNLIFPNRLTSFEPGSPQKSVPTHPLSGELAKSVSLLPPTFISLFNSLPSRPPLASTDPNAALALHNLLSALDPTIAVRWHWRDTRKVLRSLCVMKETGRKTSEILREQSEMVARPRYHTLCFWLYAEPSVLHYRLDKRVDEMIEQGLIDEIRSLREIATPSMSLTEASELDPTDYTVGIYQAIGYKEFHDYLSSPSPSEMDFNNAVMQVKHSTRKYAKRQISWLKNKLLPAMYAANVERTSAVMYLLDATELGDEWVARVRGMAERITQDFLEEKQLPDPLSLSAVARSMLCNELKHISPESVLDTRRKIICPVCTTDKDKPVMIEEYSEWVAHQKNRLHRRLAKKAKGDGASPSSSAAKHDH